MEKGETKSFIPFLLVYLMLIGALDIYSAALVENDYCKGSGLLKEFMHEHSISVMVTITAIYLSLAFFMLDNSPSSQGKKGGKTLPSRIFEWFITAQGIVMVIMPMRQLKLLSGASMQEMRECPEAIKNLLYVASSNLEAMTFNFLFNISSLYFLVAAGLVATLMSKKEGKNETQI